MAFPIILVNKDTGADTNSGAGPATPVTGTSAAHTGGVSSTTITLTNTPDLSGVAADGSHAIFLNTGVDRHVSKIIGVDDGADTVTVEDSFNISNGAPVNYSIGGKRATFKSDNYLWTNTSSDDGVKGGWIMRVEKAATAYDNTLTTCNAGGNVDGPFIFEGSDPAIANFPEITESLGNASTFTFTGGADNVICRNIKFSKTFNSSVPCLVIGSLGGAAMPRNFILENCEITNTGGSGTSAHGVRVDGNSSEIYIILRNLYVHDCKGVGILKGTTSSGTGVRSDGLRIENCYLKDNDTGIRLWRLVNVSVEKNIIVGSNEGGIEVKVDGSNELETLKINANTIDDNGKGGTPTIDDGIFIEKSFHTKQLVITNNIITNNVGYGINIAEGVYGTDHIDHNNYGTGADANTIGDITPAGSKGSNDKNLLNQFTDSANDDYSIGTNLKALGFPKNTDNIGISSATKTFSDIGVAQRQDQGLLVHSGMNGGLNA